MGRQSENVPPGEAAGIRSLAGTLIVLSLLLVPPAIPHLLALRIPGPPPRPVDAVFVLSGGEGRIPAGYRIWSSGMARELYILGAGRRISIEKILPGSSALSPESLSRIHVEGWSMNTLENAFSAESVLSRRGFTSATLVTSGYHVPRAYLAFRKVLPAGVALYVYPVNGEGEGIGGAWRWARRHFIEGWKYWGYRALLRWE